MKKITTIAVILLASFAIAGSASAQDHAAKANIPFGFYVQNKWVPAGTYTLTANHRNTEVITIRNRDSSVALLQMGNTVDPQPGAGKLVFHKYGDLYFLDSIRCSACRMNVAFNPSSREKEEQMSQASNRTEKTVYLALN